MTHSGETRSGDAVHGDRYAMWDAAYALGSLSSAERREYQTHLEGCSRCRAALGEISAMPALLAMLDAADVVALDDELAGPPPLRPEVLGSVLDEVRRRRRRSRWVTSAAVGFAAALLAIGLLIAARPELVGLQSGTEWSTAQQLPMDKVAESTPFSATVALSSFSWGTRIDMACTYGTWSNGEDASASNLGMVVVGRDGSRTQVATWLGLSGATALPSGNAPVPASNIAAVQLVSVDTGKVLLERRL